MSRKTAKDIDDYIARYPAEVQQLLEKMRLTIKKAAPRATETVSYGIPAFRLDGMLVWLAAFKNHVGFYPGAEAIRLFKKELSEYKAAKGSVQFPLDQPLPLALIGRVVKFRVKHHLGRKKH